MLNLDVDKKVFDCVRHIAAIDNLPDSITAQRGELWSFQIYALLYKSRNLENQDDLEKIRMLWDGEDEVLEGSQRILIEIYKSQYYAQC